MKWICIEKCTTHKAFSLMYFCYCWSIVPWQCNLSSPLCNDFWGNTVSNLECSVRGLSVTKTWIKLWNKNWRSKTTLQTETTKSGFFWWRHSPYAANLRISLSKIQWKSPCSLFHIQSHFFDLVFSNEYIVICVVDVCWHKYVVCQKKCSYSISCASPSGEKMKT